MAARTPRWLVLALVGLAACGADAPTPPVGGRYLVEFLNLSGATLSVTSGGETDLGDGGRFCLEVSATAPSVAIRQQPGAAVIPFTPSTRLGDRYTVVLYTDAVGTVRALNTTSVATAPSGQLPLRAWNGHSAPVDVYLTAAGAPLATAQPLFRAVPPLTMTAYLSQPQGIFAVTTTLAGTKTLVADAGPLGFTSEANRTLAVVNRGGSLSAELSHDCTVAAHIPAR